MDDFLYKYDLMLEELHSKLVDQKPKQKYWFSTNTSKKSKFDCNILSDYAELESIFRNFKKSLEVNPSKDNPYSNILAKSLRLYIKYISFRLAADEAYMYYDSLDDDVSVNVDFFNDTKELIINSDSCKITYQFQISEINRIDKEPTNILDEFINNKSSKRENVIFVHLIISPNTDRSDDIELSIILDQNILTDSNIEELKLGTIVKITNNAIFDSFVNILEKVRSYSSLVDYDNISWKTIFENNIEY